MAFAKILQEGGHKNSLGRAQEVIDSVLKNKTKLEELYDCLFDDDAWVRMRAADALEKICREHPEWIEEYIDKIQRDLSGDKQASIQWHMAQIYSEVSLTDKQRVLAISWMDNLLSDVDVDWIVSANCIDTLLKFTNEGLFDINRLSQLLEIQSKHKSKAVRKRVAKLSFS